MMLNSISPSANGKILPGDRIAMVRNEDVTGMPMLRGI